MSSAKAASHKRQWFWIPLRVLLVSFLLTLLTFAVCLLLGILGLLIHARLRGVDPNLTAAYRQIALPAARWAAGVAMVGAIALEVRHLRRQRRKQVSPCRRGSSSKAPPP